MRTYSFLAVLMFCSSFCLANSTLPVDLVSIDPPTWEKMGQQRLDYSLDRDGIPVTMTNKAYTSIRLTTVNMALQIERCLIKFEDGSTKEVNIGQRVKRNESTNPIRLPGDRSRVVTKVVVWYETLSAAQRDGRIELWGRS